MKGPKTRLCVCFFLLFGAAFQPWIDKVPGMDAMPPCPALLCSAPMQGSKQDKECCSTEIWGQWIAILQLKSAKTPLG